MLILEQLETARVFCYKRAAELLQKHVLKLEHQKSS